MRAPMISALLMTVTLSGCVAGAADDSTSYGDEEAIQTEHAALTGQGIEHVLNPEFELPQGQSLSSFLVPTFYSGNSAPFLLSLSNSSVFWYGQFSVPNNDPNSGALSSYVRFLKDTPGASSAVLLSVSPGVTSGLCQPFASYPGGSAVKGPSTISTRVKILSGDLFLELGSKYGWHQCSVASTASTPRGEWVTLTTTCAAPLPLDASNPASGPAEMISIAAAGSNGVVAIVDWISVKE